MSNRQTSITTFSRGPAGPSRQPEQQGKSSRDKNQSSDTGNQIQLQLRNFRLCEAKNVHGLVVPWQEIPGEIRQPGEPQNRFKARVLNAFTRSGRFRNLQAVKLAPGDYPAFESRVADQTASGTRERENYGVRSHLDPDSTASPGAEITKNDASGKSKMTNNAAGPYSKIIENKTSDKARMKNNADTCVVM